MVPPRRSRRATSVINFSTFLMYTKLSDFTRRNPPRWLFTRVNLVQHQVNRNTRQRHVNPDRENQTSDSPVCIETTFEPPPKCHDDKRSHKGGKDCMRSEDREINWSGQPFAGETRGSEAEVVRPKCVMQKIADEEQRRNRTRSDHAGAMQRNAFRQDSYEAGQQEQGRRQIEKGI
jgi:hypothetical protein